MAVKPWFQIELERVTRERWLVTTQGGKMSLRCQHGMKIFVPFPAGLDRPFLNDTAERQFVGKILPAHRPFAEVRIPYPELSLN